MTRQHPFLTTAAAAVAFAATSALAQDQPTADAPPAAPVAQAAPAEVAPLVEGIRAATDPSTAVSAYAAAVGRTGANDPAVADAYVRKMVEFNLPDLAESQARELLKQDPKHDVARAVVAYTLGRRGQATDALATIVQATTGEQTPTDPFVLRTAGQLVAWYDTRADKATLPERLKDDVETMRKKLSPQDTYGLAYGAARDAYNGKASAANATATDLQQTPTAAIPDYTHDAPAVTQSQPPVLDNTYSDPSYYNPPYTYPDYFPSSYTYYNRPYYSGYGGFYGPGYIPPVIIRDRHHHWDRHKDRDHDHDRDHGDGGHGSHGGGRDNDGKPSGGNAGGGQSYTPPPPRGVTTPDVKPGRTRLPNSAEAPTFIGDGRPKRPGGPDRLYTPAPSQAQSFQRSRASDSSPSRTVTPAPSQRTEPAPRVQPQPRPTPPPARSTERSTGSQTSRSSSSSSGGKSK
jgi:hypothetical protein